jgi:hypothetical protein
MPRCLLFSNVFVDNSVDPVETYELYYQDDLGIENCGSVAGASVHMTNTEYVQLESDASAIANLDNVALFIQPAEVATSFGVAFALMFALAAIGYNIKVAKRMVKMS